jgi:hypothetical protein
MPRVAGGTVKYSSCGANSGWAVTSADEAERAMRPPYARSKLFLWKGEVPRWAAAWS